MFMEISYDSSGIYISYIALIFLCMLAQTFSKLRHNITTYFPQKYRIKKFGHA